MEFRAVPMERLAELLEFQLDRGGRAALTVTGNSMVPMLRHRRDSVVLTRPPEGGPRRGDIILYRRDSGQYVLHRVVEARGEDSLVCCGDHDWRREAVSPGQVLAVVESCAADGTALLSLRNKFSAGDAVELVGPGLAPIPFSAPEMADAEGTPLTQPRTPRMTFRMRLPRQAPPLSILRACRENS